MLGAFASVLAAPAGASAAGTVPGELLVRFEPGTTSTEREALRELVGVTDAERVALPRLQLVEVPEDATGAALRRLRQSPLVTYAEPNRVYRLAALPNDPLFDELWGLHNTGQRGGYVTGTPDADVDAPEAWEAIPAADPVTVAVVDSGVDASHPDIAPQLLRRPNGELYGFDFVQEDWVPEDANGHGTHVAATIAARANDGFGVAGVAPNARIMPVRAFDVEGFGDARDITEAIQFATQSGAKVVNASFGGGSPSSAVRDAITAAPDVLFVAAAGNAGSHFDKGGASYPCAYTHVNVICVGATDRNDLPAWYSNRGSVSVDLFAPGSEVLSALIPEREVYAEGFEGDGWSGWSLG